MVLATRFFRCLGRWVHAVVTKEQRERVTKHIFAASFLSKRQMPPAKYLPGYNPSQDRGNKVQHSDWTRRSYRRNASHKTTEFFQRKMKQRKRRRRRKNDWEDESESDGEGFMLSARMTKKLSTVRCIAVGGGRRLGLVQVRSPSTRVAVTVLVRSPRLCVGPRATPRKRSTRSTRSQRRRKRARMPTRAAISHPVKAKRL